MSYMQSGEKIPEPECRLGYPKAQLDEILLDLGYSVENFNKWFRGQTGGVCDGRRWNPDTKEYEPTRCGPHGMVVYTWDVKQYLRGGPALD